MGRAPLNREAVQKKKAEIEKNLKTFVEQFTANKQLIFDYLESPEMYAAMNSVTVIEMFEIEDDFEFKLERLSRLKIE